ncbi:hypothetical protein HYU18_01760 [Candidatus Woesearchaeota archaeon]|nr:hypothetical protein [Candidatus Woesearchaeota archaeon]
MENFIKRIEEVKNKTGLDLSLGEDLSIGLMNLISLEEHFLFSFVKTYEQRYLDMLEQTREIRKRLLKKIVKENNAEDWCISKHLLAATMRLTEVGTKYLHDGKRKEAEEMFLEAFNLYTLFWSVNGAGGSGSGKLAAIVEKQGKSRLSGVAEAFKKLIDCCKE